MRATDYLGFEHSIGWNAIRYQYCRKRGRLLHGLERRSLEAARRCRLRIDGFRLYTKWSACSPRAENTYLETSTHVHAVRLSVVEASKATHSVYVGAGIFGVTKILLIG